MERTKGGRKKGIISQTGAHDSGVFSVTERYQSHNLGVPFSYCGVSFGCVQDSVFAPKIFYFYFFIFFIKLKIQIAPKICFGIIKTNYLYNN